MCRTYQDHAYDSWPEVEDLELSKFKRFLLNHYIPINIGQYRLKGWKGALTFYAWKCPDHGIITNYRSGRNQTLYCPKCQDEFNEALLKKYAPIGGGGASRSSEEVSIVGNTMRAHSVAFTDPSEDKEASSK